MSLPLLALSIDINGIGTVLPSVQRELDVPAGTIGWLVSTTSLTMAATLILVGRVAPRAGNRRLVLLGACLFGVASLACALAPTFWVLVAARVGQGLGGVLMFTTSLAVINSVFDDHRRAAAVGAWGLVNGLGGALGPVVAGVATTVSWRAFFLINVPLCLAAVPVMATLTPRDHPEPSTGPVPYARLALLGAALVALTWGFQNTANAGWTAPATVGALVFAGAALLGLVVAARRGLDPLIFRGTRRSPRLFSANIVAFTANWGFGVIIVGAGLYLQVSLQKSPLESGMIFAAFSVACAAAGLVISRVSHRLGVVWAMAVAMVLVTASLALGAAVLSPSAGLVIITAFLVVAGFGQGLAFDLSTLAALEGVPQAEAAEAAGIISVVRSMGFTIGIALSTTVGLGLFDAETPEQVAHGVRVVMLLAAGVAALGIAGAAVRNGRSRATGTVAP